MIDGEAMSHTLVCNFTVESTRGRIYWWPLLFEAMRRCSLQFASPYLTNGYGWYLYDRKDAASGQHAEEVDSVAGSFTDLWDEIFTGSHVLVSFWSKDEDPLILEVQVGGGVDPSTMNVSLSVEGAEFMERPAAQARERLDQVMGWVKTVYEICQPCTGEIHWLFAGVDYDPWASFGRPIARETPSATTGYGGPEKTIVEQILPWKGLLSWLDPVPIPKGWEWDFLSLREVEK